MSALPLISLTAPVGPADAPLVVLGPSLGTSTILWDDVLPLLADDYRVSAWDLPGHGAGPVAREPFSVADLADAVAAAVTDETYFYAGVSLGGATGLELALRHGDRLRAAAIVASGAQLGDPAAWADRAAQARAQSTSSLIVASAQRWFAPDSIARRPDLTGRLLHALQDADDDSYARCCEALAAYDVRSSLGEIAVPVLAAWGAFDAVAPEAKALEIAEGVRDGRVARIDEAGHLPPAEQPEAVAALLRSFFASASREDA
ncbi:alpha/beta fold hydrolase [Microbacterium proteolyticum]|uniref:alpha/beta fold hydrolase n=1 Tax=Microbacterium proteolyticum TaxID=1572644 RepID=UPI001FAC3383|nr:alpha/beta fold hydrolase [Microbacterium proteolyticum]MCI9858301.1 alpha/beta fold hydrolase [Microbacterium proteolyticum]